MLNMKIHTKILKKIACIGQRLMYPIMEKKIISHHARFLFFNRKYIAKISNPITKPQFLAIIKLTYTEIIKQKKR